MKQKKWFRDNTSPPPTSRLLPSQSPSNDYLTKLVSLRLAVEYDVTRYGISLQSVWFRCPGCVSSQFTHPQCTCFQDSGKKKSLMLCNCCSTIVRTLMLSTQSYSQIQNTALYRMLWRKLTPPQLEPVLPRTPNFICKCKSLGLVEC